MLLEFHLGTVQLGGVGGGGGGGASRVHYGGCANGELDCLRHVRRDFLSAER